MRNICQHLRQVKICDHFQSLVPSVTCLFLDHTSHRHKAFISGYTIPHHSERKVAFMLRVREGYSCQEVMRDGFRVLMDIFGTVGKKFSEAVVKYKMEKGLTLDDEDLTTFGDSIQS